MTDAKDERTDVAYALKPLDDLIRRHDESELPRYPVNGQWDTLNEVREMLAKRLRGCIILPGYRCRSCGFFNGAEKETLPNCRGCGLPKSPDQ